MRTSGLGSVLMRATHLTALLTLASVAPADTILFQDNFATLGNHLDYSKWTTLTGSPSFLGRTQLADWLPGGSGQFVVGEGGAQLTLNTFNPTDPTRSSLYGTQGMTIQTFQPSPRTAIELNATLQLTSLQSGLVYAVYFYGCNPDLCATNHDEIDIELLTNTLQTNGQFLVELNRYSNEPLGLGHGELVSLPTGFDPLSPHRWTIRWSLTSIDYYVDGQLLATATDHVPQGAMSADVEVWGPDMNWPEAYSPTLQPVSTMQQNQAFTGLLTSVMVSQTTAQAPSDFNGDSVPDLVWQNDTSRQVGLWYMGGPGGTTFQSFGWLAPGGVPGWTVVATADVNRDGTPDLIWQNDTTRQVAVWYMGGPGGTTYQGFGWLNAANLPGWTVAAMADVNGDGIPDVIWQNDATRQVAVWYMTGTQGTTYLNFGWLSQNGVPGWTVVGLADMNQDGVLDVLWQNDATRQLAVWYMTGSQGTTFESFAWLSSNAVPGWTCKGAVDLNADGVPDLIWENDTTRQVAAWYMSGPGGTAMQGFGWLNAGTLFGWTLVHF